MTDRVGQLLGGSDDGNIIKNLSLNPIQLPFT